MQGQNNPQKTLVKMLSFWKKEFDESEFSQEVSDRFKTNHHLLRLDEEQLLQVLPSSLSAMDQPSIDGINTYLISRSAHEVGLKVALSGLGGDELFGGYPSFQLIPKLMQIKKLLNLFTHFLFLKIKDQLKPHYFQKIHLLLRLKSYKMNLFSSTKNLNL